MTTDLHYPPAVRAGSRAVPARIVRKAGASERLRLLNEVANLPDFATVGVMHAAAVFDVAPGQVWAWVREGRLRIVGPTKRNIRFSVGDLRTASSGA